MWQSADRWDTHSLDVTECRQVRYAHTHINTQFRCDRCWQVTQSMWHSNTIKHNTVRLSTTNQWHTVDSRHQLGTMLTGDPDSANQPIRKLTSFKKFSKLKYPDCTLLQSDGINQTWLNFKKSPLHTEPNNGSNSLINVTLVYTMCCKKNETRLQKRLMHIKRGTACARSKESTAISSHHNRSIEGPQLHATVLCQ